MTTHTPGPWKVYSQYGEIGNITNSDCSVVVAQAQQVDPRSHEVRLANTHLIASAPELLKEAESAVRRLDWFLDANPDHVDSTLNVIRQDLRTAIAKAKGEQQ